MKRQCPADSEHVVTFEPAMKELEHSLFLVTIRQRLPSNAYGCSIIRYVFVVLLLLLGAYKMLLSQRCKHDKCFRISPMSTAEIRTLVSTHQVCSYPCGVGPEHGTLKPYRLYNSNAILRSSNVMIFNATDAE